eukprot:959833_1
MIGQTLLMVLLGVAVSNAKRPHLHHQHHWKLHCNHVKRYHSENELQTETEPLGICAYEDAEDVSRMATCTEDGIALINIYAGPGCDDNYLLFNGSVEEMPHINYQFDMNVNIEITCDRDIDCGVVITDGVILDNETNETCAAYGNRTDETLSVVDGACQVYICDDCDDSWSEVIKCTETGAKRMVWDSLDCTGKPKKK